MRIDRRAPVPLLILLVVLAACGDGTVDRQRAESLPSTSPTAVAPAPSLSPAPSPVLPPPSAVVPPPAADGGVLQLGDTGPEVLGWQQALAEKGFWLGLPDGRFGTLTQQATYALEKLTGLPRRGTARAQTRAALAEVRLPRPQLTGRGAEIDLARQVLLLVDDGGVVAVLSTSTGSGERYVDGGRTRRAVTPRGTFTVDRQIDGLRRSPLGVLWRPKYFNGGIAVHGAPEVPPWPASHGCVRLTNAAIDWIWLEGHLPLGAAVLVR